MIDLEHSYNMACADDHELSRLEFLATHIFKFTTYATEYSERFAAKALEVCAAISAGKTFGYIADESNHQWYLLMVNMPFFEARLNWGTSIRGAWWAEEDFELSSCGLWDGDCQSLDIRLTREEWLTFIADLIAFAKKDTAP